MNIKIILNLLVLLLLHNSIIFAQSDSNGRFKEKAHFSDGANLIDSLFNGLKFNKVIAYFYEGKGQNALIIDKNEMLNTTVHKSIVLHKEQTKEFIDIFSDTTTFSRDVALCFFPRFGIVFYDGTKPILSVSICLECNSYHSSIALADFQGFSSKGRSDILNFQKNLNPNKNILGDFIQD